MLFFHQFAGKEKLETFLKLEDLENAFEKEAEIYRSRFRLEVETHGIQNPRYYRFVIDFTLLQTYYRS